MTPVSAPLAELAEVTTSTAAVGVDSVYLAVTARPRMDVSDIIRAIRELPEVQEMSVVMPEQMRRQHGDVRKQEPQVQHDPAQGSGEVDDLVVASPAVVCWQGADPARRP